MDARPVSDDPIEVNVAGRLMLLLARHGLLDNRCLSIYQCAVSDVVRLRLAQQLGGMEPLLNEQLTMLDEALATRRRGEGADRDAVPAAPSVGAEAQTDTTSARADDHEQPPAKRTPREAKAPSGYVPTAKSMEEKLKDARTPIQTLLREDCVQVGLIDAKLADKLILGMTGKTSEQAERDIVEQLRQVLQDQVKSFIRKARGGPWSNPRTQEDLRQDIHAAKSIRSILMMTRQVTKEYQTWQQQNRRGGILGLFSPRRRIVQRP